MQPFKQRKLHQTLLALILSYTTQSCSQGISMDVNPREELQKKLSRIRSSFRKREKVEVDSEKQHEHNYQAHYILLKAITEELAANFNVSEYIPANAYDQGWRETLYPIISAHIYGNQSLDPTSVRIDRLDGNLCNVLFVLFHNSCTYKNYVAEYDKQSQQQIKDSLLMQIKQTADVKQNLEKALEQAQKNMDFVDIHSVNYAGDKIRHDMSVTLAKAAMAAIESNLHRAKVMVCTI